jgi:PBSX family phage terminase large subunit
MVVKLSPWQTKVWDDTHRFKVLNLGRRSGKTVLAVVKIIHFACTHPNSISWYVSPTYRQSKSIAWSLFKQFESPVSLPRYNETELSIKLKNGAEIYLKGADNPDSLRGNRIDFCVFDEVAFMDDWDEIWKALRPTLIDSQAEAWFISTPNGQNHFKKLSETQDADYKYFHFTSYDNPYITREELDKTRQEMLPDDFAQEFLGEFKRRKGAVYRDWDQETQFLPIEYDHYLPLYVSFDWGVNDPTAILWLQPSKQDLRIIDAVEIKDSNLDTIVGIIKSKNYKSPIQYFGDPAGKARTLTTGKSPIEMLQERGIYVTTKDGVKIPDQIRATSQHVRVLKVSNKLEHVKDCLLNYHYPDKGENLLNQSNEIPVHDKWSHTMRALEYFFVNYRPQQPVVIPQNYKPSDSVIGI